MALAKTFLTTEETVLTTSKFLECDNCALQA